MDALSLEEDERQLRESQRSFGVTPEEVARARWQRTTRDHWSLDAPSGTGGSGPSLQGVGGAAAPEAYSRFPDAVLGKSAFRTYSSRISHKDV